VASPGREHQPDVSAEPANYAEIGANPGWFNAVLLIASSLLLCLGTVGLVLAYLGRYRLALALGIGLPVAAVVVAAGWGAISESKVTAAASTPRRFGGPARAVCAIALASALFNIAFESNHVAVNRDPGAYAVTAKWIATQGSLQVPAEPLWRVSGVPVLLSSFATYLHGDGGLQLQFAHFVPVLYAEADGIGGDRALFATPAVLGALALLAVYAVGCCLCRRPWLVVAAVATLAVSLPQLNVSRDTFSEAGTQLLLWTGLWLMLRWLQRPRSGTAAVAGLMLAGALLTRIDALVYVIAVPILLVLLWHRRARQLGRATLGRHIALFVTALAAGGVLAALDITQRSAGYYSMLRPQVLQLCAGLVAALVAAALLWLYLRGRAARSDSGSVVSSDSGSVVSSASGRDKRGRAVEQLVARCAPGAVAVVLLAGWLIRPYVDHPKLGSPNDVVAGLQAQAGKHVDALSSYGQRTLSWMSWYLGPVTLALAIIGVAALVAVAVRLDAHRQPAEPSDYALTVLSVLGLATALYLWKPSIVPDQIWASRRFVPAALPLLALSAAAGLDAIVDRLYSLPGGRVVRSRYVRATVAVAVVAMIGPPAYSSAKVARLVDQGGYLAVIDSTCRVIGPDSVVVFNPGGRLELTWPQTVRSWCGVPVASLESGDGPSQVAQLAAVWRSRGRTLWVLSDTPADVRKVLTGSTPVTKLGAATSRRELIQTIARLPDKYVSQSVAIYGAPA
jgi:hypothetical protein